LGEFEPKSSTKFVWYSGSDEARVIMDIEILDSLIEKKNLKIHEENHCLTVMGLWKEIFTEDEKQKGQEGKVFVTKGTRTEGRYALEI